MPGGRCEKMGEMLILPQGSQSRWARNSHSAWGHLQLQKSSQGEGLFGRREKLHLPGLVVGEELPREPRWLHKAVDF